MKLRGALWSECIRWATRFEVRPRVFTCVIYKDSLISGKASLLSVRRGAGDAPQMIIII